MLRLAQFCLIAQIILAPLLLGGARPWAMAILSILTGAGLLAVARYSRTVYLRKYLISFWLLVISLIGWSILQSLPVWPVQSDPFNAPHIALYPDAWINMALPLIWLAATVTLASLIAQSGPERWIGNIVKSVIATCCLQLILAATNDLLGWQTTFWFTKTAHIGDWTGSFANRNAFGILMTIGFVACLYLFARSAGQTIGQRLDRSGGDLALAILFGCAVIQSHSRSAIAMIMLATIVFITFNSPSNWRHVTKRLVITIAGAVGVISFMILTQPDLAHRFAELARLDLIQRDDAWATALVAIQDRPMTGFGPDSIALVMGHFATPELNTSAHWFSSHNLWLDGAMYFGLPVLITIFVCLGILAVFILRNTASRSDMAFGIAVISVITLGSVLGWVISLPALVLPVAIILVAIVEAGIAQHGGSPSRADPPAQSPVPDQAIAH
jgi:O-antigen ligase